VGPDGRAHRRTDYDQELPDPDGREDGPVAPVDHAVQPQGQQHREEQQAWVDQELTARKQTTVEFRAGVPNMWCGGPDAARDPIRPGMPFFLVDILGAW